MYYGQLIDIFNDNEKETFGDALSLVSKFKSVCPSVVVRRPERFYNTVESLTMPTKPSIKGGPKLQGSPLAT
jgi:hypothetical protein